MPSSAPKHSAQQRKCGVVVRIPISLSRSTKGARACLPLEPRKAMFNHDSRDVTDHLLGTRADDMVRELLL